MRPARGFLFLSLGLCLASAASSLADTQPEWIEGRSPHFQVISNASPKKVQAITQRLEDFRYVLASVFPDLRVDPPIPTSVLFFKNEKTLRPYQRLDPKGKPMDLAGFFQPGAERMHLVVNVGETNAEEIAFHEYVHLVLALNFDSVPVWLNEGLAMFYERTDIDGAKFILGYPQQNYWAALQENTLIPLEVLTQADDKSEYYNVPNKRPIFYGESWLLVHYLITSQKDEESLTRFVSLLRRGTPQDKAFTEAFRASYKEMEHRLQDYLQQTTVTAYRGRLVQAPQKISVEFQPVETGLAQAYLADLWINSGRITEAETALKALAGSPAPHPEVLLRLGRLALARQQFEEAEGYFGAALKRQPDDIGLRYYAALALSQRWLRNPAGEQETRAAAAQIVEYLSPILAAKADFPGAYELLIYARMARGDPAGEMIPVLERFRQLMPQRRELNLMLARYYLQEKRWDEGEKLLQEMSQNPSRPEERQEAEALLRQAHTFRQFEESQPTEEGSPQGQEAKSGNPASSRQSAPVEPPASKPAEPPKVSFVKGILVNVACSGDAAVITVQPESKGKSKRDVIHLAVPSLSRLLTIDPAGSGKKLECGAPGISVGINYRVQPDGPNIAGVVMTIEFQPAER